MLPSGNKKPRAGYDTGVKELNCRENAADIVIAAFLGVFGYRRKRIAKFFRFMDDGEKKCICKYFKHIHIARIFIVSTKLAEELIKAFREPV